MLIGKKISLKPIEIEDSKLLQQLMNDPLITNNTVGWSFPVSLHSQESFIKSLPSTQKDYRFIIKDNELQKHIGMTGLWNINWQNRSAESGIKILSQENNKGYGTESLMLMMAWAFYSVGLRRLYAEILSTNKPSLTLYIDKCHWRNEGVQKEAIFKAGEWCDLHNLAILKEEFDQHPDAKRYINFVCPTTHIAKKN